MRDTAFTTASHRHFRLSRTVTPIVATALLWTGGVWIANATALQDDNATATTTTTAASDIDALLEAYSKDRADLFNTGNVTRDSYTELLDKYRSQIDPPTLSLDETIAVIEADLSWGKPEFSSALANRLSTWADEPTMDGAVASIHRVSLMSGMRGAEAPSSEEKAKMVRSLMGHPKVMDAARDGHAPALFSALGSIRDDSIYREHREAIFGMSDLLSGDVPANAVLVFEQYFNILGTLVETAENEEERAMLEQRRQASRKQMVDVGRRVLAMPASETPELEEGSRERVAKSLARLDGAAARGELVDHSAPGIEFNWSSDGRLKSLSDLNGEVVVLDFWATWCGPCIATFPNVRKLTAFYEDYPVAIVGVTSLQGRHYGEEGVVETEGDPEKEYNLMTEFMQEKDMNWTVAFSEADVFNPEYGVRGIPHVAIVDPKGVVRESGLHPGGALLPKAEKINNLLEAAGLPAPSLEGLDNNLDPIEG